MIFLPGTFTATLFSMPWFEDLAGNGNATIQMKVYTILTVLLTAGVISGACLTWDKLSSLYDSRTVREHSGRWSRRVT
ncbi:hypothetical protein HYQ44_006764 [Verticillium longisporum]|nr:hypothetical protein HYQ44_006764 [Verticillium longisporum]